MVDATSALSIIFIISIVLVFIFIIYFIYYSIPGSFYSYELYLFLVLILFIIAVFLLYLFVYKRPANVPFGVIIPPGPVTPTAVTYGDSFFLNTNSEGTGTCQGSTGVTYLVGTSLSVTMLTLASGNSGENLRYGDQISLILNSNLAASFILQDGLFRVYFPTSGGSTLNLTVHRAQETSSTSSVTDVVLTGDPIVLTSTDIDPSSPSIVYQLVINTADSTGLCGNHVDLVPVNSSFQGEGIFRFDS